MDGQLVRAPVHIDAIGAALPALFSQGLNGYAAVYVYLRPVFQAYPDGLKPCFRDGFCPYIQFFSLDVDFLLCIYADGINIIAHLGFRFVRYISGMQL